MKAGSTKQIIHTWRHGDQQYNRWVKNINALIKSLLSDGQKALYKYLPTNLTKEMYTHYFAKYKPLTRPRLDFYPITLFFNQKCLI